MNQINKSTKRHPERGITLISLIITIIILVIISAIVIRTLTGDNDLIGMGAEGAENYKVAEYKEMLSIQITTTVQENMIKGEKTTLDDIASDIKENYTWAKSATVHEDEAITNSDILVTTDEDYVFQIYYNEGYSAHFIEYIGKGKETDFPTISMSYDRIDTKIEAIATAGSGKLTNLELIYQGETLPKEETDTESTLTKVITEKGWYTAKALDTKGRARYAWARANNTSGSLESPKIEVTKGKTGVENWYRDDEDGNFEITINGVDELTSKIYYRVVNSENVGETSENWTEVSGKTAIIPKTNIRAGQNKIYAYAGDETGKATSDDSYFYSVNYDNTKPTASFTVNGEAYTDENKDKWYNKDVTIEITGEDTGSGTNGYIYYLNGSETGITEKDLSKPVTLISEGENTIQIQTIDKAGNVSAKQEIKIKLDKTAPVFSSNGIRESNITKTGFTINVLATDKLSKNISYKCYITEQGTTNKVELGEGQTNTSGTFTANSLKENTRYNIEIEAEDEAGNKNVCTGFVITGNTSGSGGNQGGTTDPDNPGGNNPGGGNTGDLPGWMQNGGPIGKPGETPIITVTAVTGRLVKDKYYTGKIRVLVEDGGLAENNGTTNLYYTITDINGNMLKTGQGLAPSVSFEYNREGLYTLRAWATNNAGERTGEVVSTPLIIDQTAPTPPTINLTGTISPINQAWHKSDVTVTITPGEDITSNIWGVGYYVEGANEIKNTEGDNPRIDYQTTSSASITITTDRKEQSICILNRQCRTHIKCKNSRCVERCNCSNTSRTSIGESNGNYD